MYTPDLNRSFDYENGFYLTASPDRMGKFAAHLDLFRMTSDLPGEIIECGVFKGCSLSRFIKFRSLFENDMSRRIIGFDVFDTFPEASLKEDEALRKKFIEQAGEKGISKTTFEHLLEALLLHSNVELVKGDVLQTVPEYVQNHPELKISLLHIDVDLYEPTRIALETLYDRVVKGGIIILDDYGAFPGANKAIDDFLEGRSVIIRRLSYSSSIAYIQV